MNIRKEHFGMLADGTAVTRVVLENNDGLAISAMDYGANLLSVIQPDRQGRLAEVTLGFDELPSYEGDHPYFGSTIGRYANRISGGRFELNGKIYDLYKNDGQAHLHGGKEGFNRKMWNTEVEAETEGATIRFHRLSPDGEEGYPGNLEVHISFTLAEGNELIFEYRARTDAATPLNLTNHTYWNLAGPGRPVLDHLVAIPADYYLQVDAHLIPTGALIPVKGTAFDFNCEKSIGREIATFGGYDHCFILADGQAELRTAATVRDPESGRCMKIRTTQPAVQFYTSNMLQDTKGRNDVTFKKHGAFCLETGGYNDAVNNPEFPSTILDPGETYHHVTRHTFWAE